MTYIGDFALGVTFDHKFTTVQSTGAPATLSGTPVISIYAGNSTTEITAGITLTVDFDSRTGLNNVRVVATAGNGFAAATNYQIVITTGTVNSVSVVGYVVGSFSIENRGIQGIKKNTALSAFTFPIADSTDHLTPKTGLTITATRSIDGAAFAACANAVTEIGATGFYKFDIAASDVNGDIIQFKMTPSAGGDVRTFTIRTTT
jgi:hypothetical protein